MNKKMKSAIERKLAKLLQMIHLNQEGSYNEIIQDIYDDLEQIEDSQEEG